MNSLEVTFFKQARDHLFAHSLMVLVYLSNINNLF